jgi:hypothetical protein
MSAGMICDNCGDVLPVNDRGDAENGEEAGWVHISTTWVRADLCTRACAIAYLQSDVFVTRHEHELAVITEIANAIADDDGSSGTGTPGV